VTDQKWMLQAIDQAQLALSSSEVPVGCVITDGKELISKAHNQTLTLGNPCAHAEILAITEAAKKLANHRLINCEVFVTLEPCLMCIGAMVQARIKRLVFACKDSRVGLLSNNTLQDIIPQLNHYFLVESGLMSQSAQTLLKDFFRQKR
jgi:tRNA(adenine34) deaminase